MWDVETPMNQRKKQDFPIYCRSQPSLVYYLLIFCQFFHFPTVARIKELSLRREPVERFGSVRSLGSIVLIPHGHPDGADLPGLSCYLFDNLSLFK